MHATGSITVLQHPCRAKGRVIDVVRGTRLCTGLACIYVPPLLLLVGIVAACNAWQIPASHLLRDPTAVRSVPSYIGLVSNLGALCWAATTAVCFFSAALSTHPRAREAWRFFAAFGALTGVLCLDDVFQIHEDLFPRFVGPEVVLVLAYAVGTATCLLVFRRFLQATRYGLLLTALGLFSLSAVADVIDLPVPGWAVLEDAAKFMGICGWLGYFATTGLELTRAGGGAAEGGRTNPSDTALLHK
jgi:hypothetical protein